MVHCTKSIGTAALVEPDAQAAARLSQVGLQSPLPLLRLIMAQSGCFRVIDRGAALSNMQQEVGLAQSGLLKSGSATAQGRMVAAQYLLTPNIIFSNPNAGGGNLGAGLGGLIPGGALIGAVAGGMRREEDAAEGYRDISVAGAISRFKSMGNSGVIITGYCARADRLGTLADHADETAGERVLVEPRKLPRAGRNMLADCAHCRITIWARRGWPRARSAIRPTHPASSSSG